MIVRPRPELTAEEKRLPLARYYDLPLHPPGPREQQILDAGPIDPGKAIHAQRFLDLLQPSGYQEVEYGYCMMPDGTGYLAVYTVYPNCTPQMLAWWFRWINIYLRGMPKGRGNLRYKIWNPLDHWDHGFVNGKDKSGGVYTVETLDLGAGEDPVYTVRHAVNLRECGLTEEKEGDLKTAGCWVDCAWESFHTLDAAHTQTPGTHLCLTLSRKSPLGMMEKCTREWIGWGVRDGKAVRDESTPDHMLCEEYLKKVIVHSTVEAQQLSTFLPEIYAQYKDLPDDAD